MEKQWKIIISVNCPNCGDELEVNSDSPEANDSEFEQWFSDGEEVRCCSECGFKSALSVSDDGEAWVQDGNIDDLSNDDDEPNYDDFDCTCGAWQWSDKLVKPIHVADCICGSSEPW